MCGIIGVFNNKCAKSLAKQGIRLMKHRGQDDSGIESTQNCAIGHALHAIVGHVKQPLKAKGSLTANCEIYNWKVLAYMNKISANNDAELLLGLIEKKKKVCDAVPLLDGDYAFAYWLNNNIVLARDLIGVKPLFYSHSNGFSFASEKKVLEKLGFSNIQELNPRKFLTYDIEKDRIYFTQRDFFKLTPEVNGNKIKELLIKSVKKRIPQKELGILFSGGVDSSLLALICKQLGKKVTLYTTAIDEPTMNKAEDYVYAKMAAKELDLPLKVSKLKISSIPKYLKKIVPLIEDTNVAKVGVALAFYPACEQARKDGLKVILSGLGSEEIFAGYQRHKESGNINEECLAGLRKMYERDLYRDDTVTMDNSLELRVPFLDTALVAYALRIPASKKIDKYDKQILRETARDMGLSRKFAFRKKRAAQYGSKMHKALQKLTRKSKYKYISEYLGTFYPGHNLMLGALISGGKDSLYAMHIMQRQNYKIECLIAIKSNNPDSYMFHTPAIDMVELQADALNIPLVLGRTQGEKEKELKDLKSAIAQAIKKHKIKGVVTGALFSVYQRNRIEKICEELGIKVFSPLWHLNQATEMREILDNGFSFIMTSIAADGLDKSWLGVKINRRHIGRLAKLNDKIGLNIAGEGGEYESLVIDMPQFSHEICIEKGKILMENPFTGKYIIQKAGLNEKKKEKRELDEILDYHEDSDHPVTEKITKQKKVLK